MASKTKKPKTDLVAAYDKRVADRNNSEQKEIEEEEQEQEELDIIIPNLPDGIVLNTNLNPRQDVIINPDELDFEWVKQPQLVSDYSEYATILEDLKRKLERRITVKRAGLDPKIRGAAKAKDEKYTEPQIKAKIEKQAAEFPEVKALDKVLFQLSIVNCALKSLDHKKKGLEWLGQLWTAGYFSTPREKRLTEGSKRVVEFLNDRLRDRQRDGLNKNAIEQEAKESEEVETTQETTGEKECQ